MGTRIHLQFDRNQDIRTDYYYIYRSTTPPVSRRSLRVMKIKQIFVPSPIPCNETPVALSKTRYRLLHTHIFPTHPFHLWDDGAPVLSEDYEVDYINGLLHLYKPANGVLTAQYVFDGIDFVDDIGENAHLDSNYYGPPAVDNVKPNPPNQFTIAGQGDGTILLQYRVSENAGQSYYYGIEARNDKGDYSLLSPGVHMHMKEQIEGVRIETSRDGKNWDILDETHSLTEYQDHYADNEPPEPLTGVTYTVKKIGASSELTFTWKTPLANNKINQTPKYRVRTLMTNNIVSDPSTIVGPLMVQTPIQKVVLRRKRKSTEFPTYDDPRAETVGEVTDISISTIKSLQDWDETCTYSLFVVDGAGNYSSAYTFLVST